MQPSKNVLNVYELKLLISYKPLHQVLRNKTHYGCNFAAVILTEIEFHFERDHVM